MEWLYLILNDVKIINIIIEYKDFRFLLNQDLSLIIIVNVVENKDFENIFLLINFIEMIFLPNLFSFIIF